MTKDIDVYKGKLSIFLHYIKLLNIIFLSGTTPES